MSAPVSYPTCFDHHLNDPQKTVVLVAPETVCRRLSRPGVLGFKAWLAGVVSQKKPVASRLERRFLVSQLLSSTPLDWTPSLMRSCQQLEAFLEDLQWANLEPDSLPERGGEWLQSYRSQLEESGLWDLPTAVSAAALHPEEFDWGDGEIVWVTMESLGPKLNHLLSKLRELGINIRLEMVSSVGAKKANQSRHLEDFEEALCSAVAWSGKSQSHSLVVTKAGQHCEWLQAASLALREPPWADGEGIDYVLAHTSTVEDAPLLNTALKILSLLEPHPLFRDWSQVLRSDSLSLPSEEAAILETRIRRRGHFRLSVDQAQKLAQSSKLPLMAGWLQRLLEWPVPASLKSPAAWSQVFRGVLEAAAWPKKLLCPGWRAQVSSVSESLQDLARLESPELTLRQALAWLQVALENSWESRLFRDTRLAVVDPELALWLRPERALLLEPDSLTERRDDGLSDWRPAKLRVRSRQAQWGRLGRLRALAEQVSEWTWSEPNLVSEGEDKSALSLLLWQSELDKRPSVTWESWKDNCPPVEDITNVRGGAKILSLQAKCPFRATAEIRLQAKPLDKVALGLHAGARGELVHSCFEEFWKDRNGPQELSSMSSQELAPLLETAVSKALEDSAKRYPWELDSAKSDLEFQRLRRLLAEGVECDLGRSEFSIKELEEDYTFGDFGFPIRLRVDRIDRLPDGRLLVLDYKTGRPSLAAWDGERPEEPQLPLYCLALGDEVAGLAFFRLRPKEVALLGFAPDKDSGMKRLTHEQWKEKCQSWKQILGALANDFKTGFAEVDPKNFPSTCRHCGLQTLCRVSELRRR